jgi:F-type H+-transporting ATPase subunit gamma
MPSIKEYNTKLHSLRNTSKMTRTMKMVSASKLRRAQQAQRQSSLYAARLNAFIARLAASADGRQHPLLQPRDVERKPLLLIYTSDRGLCGGFNNNLIRMAARWMADRAHRFPHVGLSFCGRRGYNYFRRRGLVEDYFEHVTAAPDFDDAVRIGERLSALFTSGAYDSVYLVYNRFRSALSQTPVIEQVLPFQSTEFLEGGEQIPSDYIFEPSQQALLDRLLPRTLYFKLYFALLENAAGEHGARMTAMDNATNNAGTMIETYTLLRNRARQAAITTELIEIVAGAEAL